MLYSTRVATCSKHTTIRCHALKLSNNNVSHECTLTLGFSRSPLVYDALIWVPAFSRNLNVLVSFRSCIADRSSHNKAQAWRWIFLRRVTRKDLPWGAILGPLSHWSPGNRAANISSWTGEKAWSVAQSPNGTCNLRGLVTDQTNVNEVIKLKEMKGTYMVVESSQLWSWRVDTILMWLGEAKAVIWRHVDRLSSRY